MRDSFSNDRLDPLVTARNTGLKTTARLYDEASCQCREGTQSSTRVTPNLSAYAGEPNLPAKELVSGGSKIVELRRLGTILSF